MSKDLIRTTDVSKLGQTNEVDEAKRALAEMMLFGAKPRPQHVQRRPRIILGLDCTCSMGEFVEARKITPEAASTMAKALFANAGPAGLEVQLEPYRCAKSCSTRSWKRSYPVYSFLSGNEVGISAQEMIERQICTLFRSIFWVS
jgi:hypothetical protein